MNDLIKRLKEAMESEEGKENTRKWVEKLENEQRIKNCQYDRFHDRIQSSDDFSKFVEKVITKYESDEYINKEYKLGRVPRTELYFFLLEYAAKYGRECNDEEYNKYGNDFTSGIYIIHGYYFNLTIGQGSLVLVGKIKE